MTSRARDLCLLALGCWLAACGAESREPYGGETNWLRPCSRDADCGQGACLCGVCTTRCDAQLVCAEPFTGTCASAGNASFDALCAAERVDGVCLPRCAADAECGEGFACEGRVCVPAQEGEPARPPAAGASAAAGTGEAGAGAGAGATSGSGGAADQDAGTRDDVLCDGTDDVRLLWSVAGGQVVPSYEFTNPYGHSFMAVDGRCQYYVSLDHRQGVATGMLEAAEAAQLAEAVGFASLLAWSGREDQSCPDAGATVIARQGYAAGCSCGCDASAPAGLDEALTSAGTWAEMLSVRGTSLAGPIAAVAIEQDGTPPNALPWPLARPIVDIAGLRRPFGSWDFEQPVLFDDSTEATQLRELRSDALAQQGLQGIVVEGGGSLSFGVYLRDRLPEGIPESIDSIMSSVQP